MLLLLSFFLFGFIFESYSALLLLLLSFPFFVFVCESESALDVMKKRLVRVSDFSVTDNHLYFPTDSKQKCFASNVHLIANCNSSNVYLIANCGDEL